LPVPLAPVRSTVESVGATRASSRSAARSRGWRPTIGGAPPGGTNASGASSSAKKAASRARSSAIPTGFSRKSAAPSFIASTAAATEP